MEYNLAEVLEGVEETCGDRASIIFRDRVITFDELGERTRRLANVLLDAGFEVHTDRDRLQPHESGQDHLALYLHNGNEYLEGMVGAYKARAAPFNVNYRYIAEELKYLLDDSGARGIIYHSALAPTLDEVRADLPRLEMLLQVPDESGHPLLDGARWYEDALAEASPDLADAVRESWSPDDLYILYTGGTTGMPKGVLWRQADIFVGALGGRRRDNGHEWDNLADLCEVAAAGEAKLMPAPPFMHGAAHWMAFNSFAAGNTLVLPDVVERFDPDDALGVVARHGVNIMLIVGDAFGRPLVESIESGRHDLSSMLVVISGGAALSAGVKNRLLDAVPSMMVMDGLGASETGAQASQMAASGQNATTGSFTPGPGMCILDEELEAVLQPGHADMGWLAQEGRVPLGYLGDPDKSARTFPTVDGVRYSVPGDRARVTADGLLELYGRDSVTINSGGEKIFAEEVELALAAHPAVYDVVVCGRPSDRWGNEVIAVVQLKDGLEATDDDLRGEAEQHIARFKLPKEIIRRPAIQRSPSGKADYRWAREQASAELPDGHERSSDRHRSAH